jgi:hypothetical protein
MVQKLRSIHLVTYDSIRYYIGAIREDTLLSRLSELLNTVKTHEFRVLSLEPHPKDGGVFVKFNYTNTDGSDSSFNAILRDIKNVSVKHGGIPSWIGWPRGDAWVIKGKPWKEVCKNAVISEAYKVPNFL